MSRAQAEGVIRTLVREIGQGVAARGRPASETLVAFMVSSPPPPHTHTHRPGGPPVHVSPVFNVGPSCRVAGEGRGPGPQERVQRGPDSDQAGRAAAGGGSGLMLRIIVMGRDFRSRDIRFRYMFRILLY